MKPYKNICTFETWEAKFWIELWHIFVLELDRNTFLKRYLCFNWDKIKSNQFKENMGYIWGQYSNLLITDMQIDLVVQYNFRWDFAKLHICLLLYDLSAHILPLSLFWGFCAFLRFFGIRIYKLSPTTLSKHLEGWWMDGRWSCKPYNSFSLLALKLPAFSIAGVLSTCHVPLSLEVQSLEIHVETIKATTAIASYSFSHNEKS